MFKRTLKEIFDENKETSPNLMNFAIVYFARGNGISLSVGNNYYGLSTPPERKIQAITFNENFIKTLKLLEAKIYPSYKEIEKFLRKGETKRKVQIISNDITLEGTVFCETLRKDSGFWLDARELKEVDSGLISITPVASQNLKKAI